MSDDLKLRLAEACEAAAEARTRARHLRAELRAHAAWLRHMAAELDAERNRTRQLLNQHTALVRGVHTAAPSAAWSAHWHPASDLVSDRTADPERQAASG